MTTSAPSSAKATSSLRELRERLKGPSEAMRAHLKAQQDARKRLRAALAGGARSVPELAQEAGLEPTLALWHLMAMRRYGEVVEAGERDRYVLYALKKP